MPPCRPALHYKGQTALRAKSRVRWWVNLLLLLGMLVWSPV